MVNPDFDKVDVLFMIDNSPAMADKQVVLAETVQDLVNRLVNPMCVDGNGTASPDTPGDSTQPCPDGTRREFLPIRDVHIGIITSSLGGHGSTACATVAGAEVTAIEAEQNDDHAELLGTRSRAISPETPPFDSAGFLSWNPDKNEGVRLDTFQMAFQNMVLSAGEHGCTYEAQLESIYRFLADPSPPEDIVLRACAEGSQAQCAFPSGVDRALLEQRRAFLRPDSLLAVIMVTDENDCSVRDEGQGYLAVEPSYSLAAGSARCDTNPNDPCCYSCAMPRPANCEDGCQYRSAPPDLPNLRCYRQKQRFGYDFLYPTQRYVNALASNQICTSRDDLDPRLGCPDLDGDRAPDLHQNPIYEGGLGLWHFMRPVFLSGIVGVPWQDIEDVAGSDSNTLAYFTTEQLSIRHVWETILGDLGSHNGPIEPSDPHMVESQSPRAGIPGVNAKLMEDPRNGHEWANSTGNDLQYACIFKLATPRVCSSSLSDSESAPPSCDCDARAVSDHDPLCQVNDYTYGTTQYYAKAYPGLRELELLKAFPLASNSMGSAERSVVASICARNTKDSGAGDFGYRPAIGAIVNNFSRTLAPKCLPGTLTSDQSGGIPCRVIEVSSVSAKCEPTRGRSELPSSWIEGLEPQLKEMGLCDVEERPACSTFSYCELAKAGPACHSSTPILPTEPPGWCYLDAALGDSTAVLGSCAARIRFIDPLDQTPPSSATLFLACSDETPGSNSGGSP